ncbi:hypothetical protein BDV97DRAFT_161374 [Delphinella strobiligena]|nr:hypothetical protein BDV97DRAFT_161374 [Delphinella strobiligena]
MRIMGWSLRPFLCTPPDSETLCSCLCNVCRSLTEGAVKTSCYLICPHTLGASDRRHGAPRQPGRCSTDAEQIRNPNDITFIMCYLSRLCILMLDSISDNSLAEFLHLAPRSLVLQALLFDMRVRERLLGVALHQAAKTPHSLLAMIFMALRPLCPPYRDRSHSNKRLIIYQTLPTLL